MNLILRYLEGRKSVAFTANPALKKQLEQTKKDLAQILNKWNWDGENPKSAQEFLNKFTPWVEEKIAQNKELKTFLAKKGVNNLKEADTKLTNRDLSEHEELTTLRQELAEAQQKHEQELAQQEQTFLNTEQDYLKQIEELKARPSSTSLSEADQEKLSEYDNLEAERDEAIREKRTLEQDLLATNNRLNLKQQEISNKEKALEKLKKEKDKQEVSLNKKLTELKEKYSKQGQLLDTEQLENNKLTERIEALETEIKQLKEGNS
jgi:chromosome segregation ATPase